MTPSHTSLALRSGPSAARAGALLGLGLVLSACQIGDGFDAYYSEATGPAPEISSVSTDSTLTGNTGGQLLTIQGSNFGEDPAVVTVTVGNLNAAIQSISDSEIVAIAPQGPVQGGFQDVGVGTPNGQAILDDGFEYVMSDVYDNQSAYIVINNDWFSCYGGVGTEFGCETFAWVGQTGISGRGEFLEDELFPRQHGQFVGYWGGADVTNEWRIDTPAYNYIPLDIEDAVEDLRDKRITGFTLRNQALSEEDPFCADLSALASYRYGGGDPVYDGDTVVGVTSPETLGYSDNSDVPFLRSADLNEDETACLDPDDRLYSLDTLQFCETYNDRDAGLAAYERAGTWIYDAEWPIGENSFFVGESTRPDRDENVFVTLDVPDAGVSDVELVLPPWPYFEATSGFNGFQGDPTFWAIGEFVACPDGDDDGTTTLDEAAWRFEWAPAELPSTEELGSSVLAMDTHVRLSVNSFNLGWYGGEGFNMRASIVVPDDNNYDDGTGRSSVELPAEILMQFPDLNVQVGPVQDGFGNTTFIWGDPITGNFGYLLVTLERVTEYRVDAPELVGDLVVSYVTGDFAFFEWDNPSDNADTCTDCQDNDGDGWTDRDDPDCVVGSAEDGKYDGEYTCNDGIDNDNDGDIDAADEDCGDGFDSETNCGDGIDNDEDGWTDGTDGECGPEGSGIEEGLDDPAWTCTNGEDDDGDTWIDADDPDCLTGADEEVGFYGGTECSDGIDNDGHGDVDGVDLLCIFRGAFYTSESPTSAGGQCTDGIDNDTDGYLDANDPDCEISPFTVEAYKKAGGSWGWTTECYNQVDDDEDGFIDADDPDCVNTAGEPDGFTFYED